VESEVIRKFGIGRFVRQAASNVIGSNAPSLFAEGENKISIKKRPCGIPMKHENGGTLPFPFVQIMHAIPLRKLHEASLEGILLADLRGQFQLVSE